jgi:hypothetical protein
MAGEPLSATLPPSPPTAACSTKTGIKDVPMNEMTTDIGQGMIDFLPEGDSFDHDIITPCFNSTPSPTLLLAEGLHDTSIKDTSIPKMTTKNGLKLTSFLKDDDHTSEEDTTLLLLCISTMASLRFH